MAQTNVIMHNIKTAKSSVQGVVIHMECSSNSLSVCLSALLAARPTAISLLTKNTEFRTILCIIQISALALLNLLVQNPQVHSVK